MRGGDVPKSAVPENKVVSAFSGIEIGELRLLRGPSAVGLGAQRLNLVIVGGVLLTGQSRRGFGPELIPALECETRDSTQPRCRHGRAGRRRWGLVGGR